jgi:hypothetical protein
VASSRTLGRSHDSTLGGSFTRYFSYSRIPWVTKRSIHGHNGKRSLGASCAYKRTGITFVLASASTSGFLFGYSQMVFRVHTLLHYIRLILPISSTSLAIEHVVFTFRADRNSAERSSSSPMGYGETHHSRGLRLCTIDSVAHQHPKPVT